MLARGVPWSSASGEWEYMRGEEGGKASLVII